MKNTDRAHWARSVDARALTEPQLRDALKAAREQLAWLEDALAATAHAHGGTLVIPATYREPDVEIDATETQDGALVLRTRQLRETG